MNNFLLTREINDSLCHHLYDEFYRMNKMIGNKFLEIFIKNNQMNC